jgi:hypothetical protein
MVKRGTGSGSVNAKVAVPGKSRVSRRTDAARIAERAAGVDLARARARESHPWGAMLNHFLTPILSEADSDPQWPRLQDVADMFKVSLQAVKARSARYGWMKQQADAEDGFWRIRNDAAMKSMGQKVVQLRGAAFAVALKVTQRLSEALNSPVSLEQAERISRANLRNLACALEAAGLTSSKVPLTAVQPMVSEHRGSGWPKDVVETAGAGGSSDPRTRSLWQMLVEAQTRGSKIRFEGPQEADPFDLPSPLPAYLAAIGPQRPLKEVLVGHLEGACRLGEGALMQLSQVDGI